MGKAGNNTLTLQQRRSKLGIGKVFPSLKIQILEPRHRLLREVVESLSLKVSTNSLDPA